MTPINVAPLPSEQYFLLWLIVIFNQWLQMPSNVRVEYFIRQYFHKIILRDISLVTLFA